MAFEVIVRKWGSSMGIVLPKEFVEERRIREGEKVGIELMKVLDISKVPKAKLKHTAQQIKDEMRKGWD